MGSPLTRDELYFSRRARFTLNKYINLNDIDGDHKWSPGRKRWNYLDYLMEQIPGKNGYGCNMTDELLWHYTSTAGFLGMLESRVLWASDATALNDPSEGQVLLELAKDKIESADCTDLRMLRSYLLDQWPRAMQRPSHGSG